MLNHLTDPNDTPEHLTGVEVTTFVAEGPDTLDDGALVIQVDTDPQRADLRLRVNVNDGTVWDGRPEGGITYPTGAASGPAGYGATCLAAGLPVMAGILDAIADRGEVPLHLLRALDAEQIGDLYTDMIAPAIDDVEQSLLSPRLPAPVPAPTC